MSKYRHQQPLLFQPTPAATVPSPLGGPALVYDLFGPTAEYVDCAAGWAWARKGGDWVDAKGVSYGPTPWFEVPSAPGGTLEQHYTADVSSLVRHCQASRRWLAILLTCAAPRSMGPRSAYKLAVEYLDGSRGVLPAWCVADANSASPNTAGEPPSLPVFLEFSRPTKTVKHATLHFQVARHWSGGDGAIKGFLLAPGTVTRPVPAPARRAPAKGLIGQQVYRDGTSLSEYVHPEPINHSAEQHFDPAIWGGPSDLTKLPHRGAGKWVLSSEDRANWSLVDSAYRGEGFVPVSPGQGALRLVMPAEPVQDGSIVGSSGSLAANGMLYLPEPLFGRLGRLFVRYYFRLGAPYKPSLRHRKNVLHSAGTVPTWTTAAGKFGIGPDHSTSWGGVSGTSGGPFGWQMRSSWYDCDAGLGGPDEGGIAVGHHLYDFLEHNPPKHRYGREASMLERWGPIGGILYAGHWYCIETELRLNDLGAENGELRTWVDGRLAYNRTGMVFRTGPVFRPPYAENQLRPARDLGIRGLWLNWFHGGKTLNTYDRVAFYANLAYGTEYIGP